MLLGRVCFSPGVTASFLPLQVAVANLGEAVKDADLLVFVIPHQFIHRICDEITGRVPKDALGITLIKVTAPRCTLVTGNSVFFPLSSMGDKELGCRGWLLWLVLVCLFKMSGRSSKPLLHEPHSAHIYEGLLPTLGGVGWGARVDSSEERASCAVRGSPPTL